VSALVRDPEQTVRLEVVRALRVLRDLSGVPALVTSLEDGDPVVREEAISALVEIYTERERSGPVGRFLETFSDEYERSALPPYAVVDPSVFRGLSERLRDGSADIRADAAYAIGLLGGGRSIPDLIRALQDPEAEVRGAAATALGKCATAEDGRALVPLLADESTTVRNRALQSIGVLRVHEAGPALRAMFSQHRRRELGTRVLATLARTGDPAQADLYRELLVSNDPEQRRLAVEGLARIADPSMLPAFKTDFQRERNGDVRIAYAFAIARLGDRAFLDSLALALGGSGATAGHARDLIIELGPGIAPDLYPYLKDRDPGVRGAVCDLLAALGDTNAAPKLTPLLVDPNPKVADRANRAIEKLRRAGAASPRP
jgi:HEAT repeat protein